MKYFEKCKTMEQVKDTYQHLSTKHHPDKGGDKATMQQINTEYSLACAQILKGHNLSEEQAKEEMKISEEYRSVIEKIGKLDNIKIESIGNWVWVTGNTLAVKKELKEAGLKFSPQKFAWYYRPEVFKQESKLKEIRDKFGSEQIKGYKPKMK